jgi:hypothetical protein
MQHKKFINGVQLNVFRAVLFCVVDFGWFNHGWLRQLVFIEKVFFDVFCIAVGLLVLAQGEILRFQLAM